MEVGIDLVLVSRFINKSEHFINRVLTEKELSLYSLLNEEKRIIFLASRWACKEAIYKATQDEKYLSYSILNNEKGKPYVDGFPNMSISISHDGDYVIAICIIC